MNVDDFYQEFFLSTTCEQTETVLYFKIFTQILNKLNDTCIKNCASLYLADHQTKHNIALYVELILNAPTLATALEITRRFSYVYSETTYWSWEINDNLVLIKKHNCLPAEMYDNSHTLFSSYNLYVMATAFLVFKNVLNDKTPFARIFFMQKENKRKHEIEAFFKASITFSQDFDGFVLSVSDFYKKNINFNADKYHKLLKRIACRKILFPDNQLFSTYIKNLIAETISIDVAHCSLINIAEYINMHPRAVQKKLLKENLTFKKLVIETKMNTAKLLLMQQSLSLTRISAILGYSEPSAFSHAFQNENNCSPKQWRQTKRNAL